jgi:hypothetical protein
MSLTYASLWPPKPMCEFSAGSPNARGWCRLVTRVEPDNNLLTKSQRIFIKLERLRRACFLA